MKLNPYLSFDGQCAEALKFYQQVLGGEIAAMMTYGETPAAEHAPPGFKDKIIHGRLVFGDNVLMASDAPSERSGPIAGIEIALNIDDPTEAERVFHALAAGGTIKMPIEETFWPFASAC